MIKMPVFKGLILLPIVLAICLLGVGIGAAEGPQVRIYFADAKESPGSIYGYAYSTTPSGPISSFAIVYTRPRGRIYSFCFHPSVEKVYLVDANDTKIYRVVRLASGRWAEDVVYTHTTYIRDVAFVRDEPGQHPEDPGAEWHLYFSEACGACGSGRIYRIEHDGSISLFYEVRLEDVEGSWAGDFAFNPFNSLVLYLSSGDRVPARIYRVSAGGVEEVFTDASGSIKGFVFASSDTLYYANWRGEIYQVNLTEGTQELVYSDPQRGWLSDVALPPEGWTP